MRLEGGAGAAEAEAQRRIDASTSGSCAATAPERLGASAASTKRMPSRYALVVGDAWSSPAAANWSGSSRESS